MAQDKSTKMWDAQFYYPGQKNKNHPCDASCDIEESAVWFRRDASMREVAAIASRVRSRFRSWIKHLDSSISQYSDFMHRQDGCFFVVQGNSTDLSLVVVAGDG